MTITLASHRPYSASRVFWRILAGLALVLVVGFILACFVGFIVILYLAVTAKGW